MTIHSLYSDEAQVGQVTKALLEAGRKVFQLWLLDTDEAEHSRLVLKALQLPMLADVLSLGCGVGGMEYHWHHYRPDLKFDLLNASKAQLALCVCPGRRILGPAEGYDPECSPDVTLIAYALGHMEAREVLEDALEYTVGPVVVLDAFDGTPAFNTAFEYNSPKNDLMRELGFTQVHLAPWVVNPYMVELGLAGLVHQSSPGLWISE
jgi:SAM-dependent methyltransferase